MCVCVRAHCRQCFCCGEGGVRGDMMGGGRFLIENPRGGGISRPGRGGREGVCRELWGGGLNIFFQGRNARQV